MGRKDWIGMPARKKEAKSKKYIYVYINKTEFSVPVPLAKTSQICYCRSLISSKRSHISRAH